MADNILDNAKEQMAGLPMPKSNRQLMDMLRSVMEEMKRTFNPNDISNSSVWSKLNDLLGFLNYTIFKDRRGNPLHVDSDDYYKMSKNVNYGWNRTTKPSAWIYEDDGNLSPLEAVSAYNRLKEGINNALFYSGRYDYPDRDIILVQGLSEKPENVQKSGIEEFRKNHSDWFFDNMDHLRKFRDSLPAGLLNDEMFRKKSTLNHFDIDSIPTPQQIMLDPVFYAEHPLRVVSDYAKQFL